MLFPVSDFDHQAVRCHLQPVTFYLRVADYVDGKIVFQAESDALIVKGIIALLIKVLSGHTPDEILEADLYFIDRIGLHEHLSPTRSNGLLSMVKQIRMYALAFKAKEEENEVSHN